MNIKIAKKNLETYKLFLDQLHNESSVVWNYSQAYIFSNTIFLTFITYNLFAQQVPLIALLLVSVVGLLTTIVWTGSSERRWKYYELRMQQTKEIEDELGIELLTGRAEKFSEGDSIDVYNTTGFELNYLGRRFTTLVSNRILEVIYFLIYFVLIIYLTIPIISHDLMISFLKTNHTWLVPIVLGFISFFIYVIKGDESGEWNPDKGYDFTYRKGSKKGRKEILYVEASKEDTLKNAPKFWVIERFYGRALGIIVGSFSLYIFLERLNINKLDFSDFILFLVWFVGLNGRLPTLAHSFQSWLGKRS